MPHSLHLCVISLRLYRDPDMQSMAGSTTSDDTLQLGGLDVCDMADFDDIDIGEIITYQFVIYSLLKYYSRLRLSFDTELFFSFLLLIPNPKIYCKMSTLH